MELIDTNDMDSFVSGLFSFGDARTYIEPEVSTSYLTGVCEFPEVYGTVNLQRGESTREEEEGSRWN